MPLTIPARPALTFEELRDPPRPLFDHLDELRTRLIRALGGWGLATAAAYGAFPRLLDLLLRPPVERLAFTSPAEPFFAQVKVSMAVGLLVSFPWLAWQAGRFVSVGLEPSERRAVARLVPASYALFLLGGALGLFGAGPLGLKFLLSYSGPRLIPLITIDAYLGYVCWLTLGLAFLFQLPIVLYALSWLGLVSADSLRGYRRHAALALLVAAAALTPGPDIVSQLLVAVPAYVLFELSLVAMRVARRG